MFRYLVAVMLLAVVYIKAAPQSNSCPENEEWNDCGRECEPSCTFPTLPSACSYILEHCADIVSGCRCKDGHARDNNDHCIWVTNCTGSLTYL
ncbi:chymotrypsin inhibitor Ani s 6-like isoform X2 [Lasioglossum baleicum]|uniref:chymotrypsin inhibitor Ani s 6-like isoform X2 n=1 Tax=Lasioglossum baleicum TaxID=434251 RepID=UPI003FCE16DF